MSANAESLPKPAGGPPKRQLKNYLLDPRFQLKYTGMVVVVTVLVASVLGFFAYDYSRGQTESMMLQMAMRPDLDPSVAGQLEEMAHDQDRKVLVAIVSGIALLAVALAVTGIVVTHRVVGPAYKLRLLLRRVGEGKLKVFGGLRKGDELQEVFEEFASMIEALRAAQSREVQDLDEAIEHARRAGVAEADLATIVAVRDRMKSALD